MAGFLFTDQRLGNNLVASAAGLLDSAGVPNFLQGNYLLTVYGVPTIVDVCGRLKLSSNQYPLTPGRVSPSLCPILTCFTVQINHNCLFVCSGCSKSCGSIRCYQDHPGVCVYCLNLDVDNVVAFIITLHSTCFWWSVDPIPCLHKQANREGGLGGTACPLVTYLLRCLFPHNCTGPIQSSQRQTACPHFQSLSAAGSVLFLLVSKWKSNSN